MAKRSKSGSIPASLSRPDSELFNRSPLAIDAGRVVCLDQFVKAVPIENLALQCSDHDEMHAAFTALFYISDPRSVYRNQDEPERISLTIKNHISPAHQPLITKLVPGKEFKLAQAFYVKIITTSQERLYLALRRQVDEYTDAVSSVSGEATAKRGKELLDSIGFAQDMAERLQKLAAFLREEDKRKTRAGYEAHLFEDKPQS